MKTAIITATFILTTLGGFIPVQAENLSHLRQLLSTKQCPSCDLSGSGLVTTNLAGANLSGANLSGANLSQANLSGANLSGANLSGASLHGANLIGANLRGAMVNGADLRNTYLTNADLTDVHLDTAFLQGAIGIPNYAGTPQMFFGWGLIEGKKGNYQAAIEHYNQALSANPDYAEAHLARGLAYYSLGNEVGAVQDAEIASKLFEAQQNPAGYQAAENFLIGMERVRNTPDPGAVSNLDRVVQGVGGLLLQILPYIW
jgi:tetratricopeptide (TPR) repeat protein